MDVLELNFSIYCEPGRISSFISHLRKYRVNRILSRSKQRIGSTAGKHLHKLLL